MARPRERDEQRGLALERVRILFDDAGRLASAGDLAGASRRMRSVRGICLRCNLRLPRELRHRFCRKCLAYFTSATMQCRLDSEGHRVRMKCLSCGHSAYRPYLKEKSGS